MTMNDDFTRGFFNTLAILRSYLPEIVIGGGWVPFSQRTAADRSIQGC